MQEKQRWDKQVWGGIQSLRVIFKHNKERRDIDVEETEKISIQCRPGIGWWDQAGSLKFLGRFKGVGTPILAIVRSVSYHIGLDYLSVMSVLQFSLSILTNNLHTQNGKNHFMLFGWEYYDIRTQSNAGINFPSVRQPCYCSGWHFIEWSYAYIFEAFCHCSFWSKTFKTVYPEKKKNQMKQPWKHTKEQNRKHNTYYSENNAEKIWEVSRWFGTMLSI